VRETLERRYLRALKSLRKQVTVLEEMARWKDDLAGRLWRAECVLRATGEFLYDVKQLEDEVRLYNEICERLKHLSDGGA
jgi:hypothetical protein